MVDAARAVSDVLSHGHLFGLKTDVKNNVHYIEEHLVAYPCGHSVVLLHLETRAQQVRCKVWLSRARVYFTLSGYVMTVWM